jgi:DNA-binding MarR family transcriptional regulator
VVQTALLADRSIPKRLNSLEHEAYLNIARTHVVLATRYVRLFRRQGISAPQYNILRILRVTGDHGLPIREIADRMTACVPDMTRLVNRLESAGFARRERSLKDRRVILIKLTPRGADFLESLEPSIREIDLELLGHLSQEELVALNRLMARAREGSMQQ